jgi:hypothetical protein
MSTIMVFVTKNMIVCTVTFWRLGSGSNQHYNGTVLYVK